MSDPSHQGHTNRQSEHLTDEIIGRMDLETARRYRQELLERKDSIDAQLGSRSTKTHRDGTPYTTEEYDSWRRRTLDAKRHVERDYRKVKQRCADIVEQVALHRTALDIENPVEVVHALTALLHQFKSQGVEFDRSELDLLITADRFVKNNPL